MSLLSFNSKRALLIVEPCLLIDQKEHMLRGHERIHRRGDYQSLFFGWMSPSNDLLDKNSTWLIFDRLQRLQTLMSLSQTLSTDMTHR